MVVASVLAVLASTTGVFELRYVKGELEVAVERVVWSSHSRLAVTHELISRFPTGWGFGANYRPADRLFNFRRIRIDGLAQTPILAGGDDANFRHLTWDVTSLPYLLKVGGRAMIVGSGGGRDIITAKTSGNWRVDAVEINEAIVRLMLYDYAEFSGHAYGQPGTTIRTVDGRTAIEQAVPGSYDLIQMSAVDTWAAGSSGSLALMENGLYTVEAFSAALAGLKPTGYLSISRFRYPDDFFGETVRMVAIALEALHLEGAETPSDNIALITNVPNAAEWVIATMLVKPTPFTKEERVRLSDVCSQRGFGIMWPPSGDNDSKNPAATLLRRTGTEERALFYRHYPIDVRPTWDDRPYFFHQARLSSNVRVDATLNPEAALRLGLGHPTHALTVVLFGLLIGTAIGSRLSGLVPDRGIGIELGMGAAFTAGTVAYAVALAIIVVRYQRPAPRA
jgi:hypothetical protein